MAAKTGAPRAPKGDEQPQTDWYLVILMTVACLLFANQFSWESTDQNDDQKQSWSSFGRPQPLFNYRQFRMLYPLEEKPSLAELSNRLLCFNLDLINIGQINLSTLSRKQTYFIQQTPVKSDRTVEEQNQLSYMLSTRFESLETESGDTPSDSAVSAGSKSGELEKKDPLIRWMVRSFKDDEKFEVPSYPLDRQPDPERITHIDSDLRLPCARGIRDQDECGACYAFSWVALAEWHYCKQTGREIDLSEQYLVDCGGKARLKGCVAGFLKDAMDFSHHFGMFTEKEYPYKGRQRSCQADKGSKLVRVKEWSRLATERENWERVLDEQPIIVEMNSPSDIDSYSRGIHPGTNCNERIKHGILLVGYGRQNGVPYWLFKNSRGPKWGENGYFRMDRRAPMEECFSNAYITKIKFDDAEDAEYADFYNSLKYEPAIVKLTAAQKAEMAKKREELDAKRKTLGGKVLGWYS